MVVMVLRVCTCHGWDHVAGGGYGLLVGDATGGTGGVGFGLVGSPVGHINLLLPVYLAPELV